MRFLISLVLGILVSNLAFGQDLHFSQFYASPLTLNPGLTGIMDEDYRLSGIHRDQWKGIDANYVSTALGADINFKQKNEDKIGVGVLFYKDDIGDGVITNQSFLLSGAYHRTLDLRKRHHISIGIQGGYTQKRINTNDFRFGNQYVNYTYNPGVDANEDLLQENVTYMDVHAGLVWTFIMNPKMVLKTGISAINITTPNESIYDEDNALGMRNNIFINFRHKLSERIYWSPRLLYMRQSKGTDAIFGAMAGYFLTPKIEFNVGPYYRSNDALILVAGVGYKTLDVKFSYDVTTSSLNDIQNASNVEGSGNRGAWEVSIIFRGVIKRKNPMDYTVPCGIF